MNYLSFFSGALGLDLGLERAGFKPLMYCEFDKKCQETITLNQPNVPLLGDIRNYSAKDILQEIGLSDNDSIDLIVGGPPCQAFSTADARRSFEDERGNVFIHYLQLATELKARYIVIENVQGLLLSAVYKLSDHDEISLKDAKGTVLEYVVQFLESKGYGVSFNLYNSANYGAPQIRKRVVIIACADGSKAPYLNPTHSQNGEFGLKPWTTLKEAISDLTPEQNQACAVFPEKRLKYYRLLKSGQNWRNLPEDLQKEAMGKSYYLGGGKTGFLRRLNWDKPSPTLVTSPIMPAIDFAHPEEDRPLSVAEYARIQQFPDHWKFAGRLVDQYKQIGNAVPGDLGYAIAQTIINHDQGNDIQPPENFPFSRYRFLIGKDMYDPKFQILLQFLKDNPDRLSSRSKSSHLDSDEGINALHECYLRSKEQKLALSRPATIPDNAVSVILQECCGFTEIQTEQIKVEHQLSMSAENLVGALLERYIAQVLEPHGWVWCAGDFVRAIDFIRYNKSTKLWEAVQVKNRDNTENSSSSAIRHGTTIEKWFRTYSKPSKKRATNTNWESFPEEEFRDQLSEEGFLQFIRNYLS